MVAYARSTTVTAALGFRQARWPASGRGRGPTPDPRLRGVPPGEGGAGTPKDTGAPQDDRGVCGRGHGPSREATVEGRRSKALPGDTRLPRVLAGVIRGGARRRVAAVAATRPP